MIALSLATAAGGCTSGGEPPPASDAGSGPDATTRADAGADGATSPDAADASPRDSACDPMYVDGEADGSGCDYFERLACNLPPGTPTEGCAVYEGLCAEVCGQTLAYPCAVVECVDGVVANAGPITIECTTGKLGCADGGRRPERLRPATPRAPAGTLGAWLAHLAWLEAASVFAFSRLEEELCSMHAPEALVRRARSAARDEVRHARVVARLAARYGGAKGRVRVRGSRQRARSRSRLAFARENAIEGCVREAFGALVATWQARRAPDPEIASAMQRIAADEARHAALAWAIARWVEPRLSAGERREVALARRGALAALRCEALTMPASFARQAGLPFGAEGAALVDELASVLLA